MSEIKISDLSVGDWVRYIRKRKKNDDYFQVAHIFRGEKEWLVGRKNDDIFGSHSLRLKDVEPIPLTPEILEKIGFVEMWDDFVVTHNGFYINIEVQENRFGLEVSVAGHIIISCDVEFVHQLQHALRLACVGKEIEV